MGDEKDMNDEMFTLAQARSLREKIHEIAMDIKSMKADKARFVSHLRSYCPHKDTRYVVSLIPATVCNTCGLANTGNGWRD